MRVGQGAHTVISLRPPQRRGRDVSFRWSVHPPTSLYRRCDWTLRFPGEIDLSPVPDRIWWTVMLVCLHAHWPLLRPCTVRLPVGLAAGEVEFWQRLLDAEVATLEAYRAGGDTQRTIRIDARGPALAPLPPLAPSARCATAFSGGKDSLLQTGLLAEFTSRPTLVTVTSPMPPLEDHLTRRRRQVLHDVVRRRPVSLVEVETDYRACWENEFPRSKGYPIAVNELSDAFVYFAALLAVGIAARAPHLFLASEAEVQENVLLDGRIVQHPHFMYSTVTQRALQALLRPGGIRYGSLTSPLHSAQVQELLWTRYPDLRDLQYSCWQVRDGEAACSRCSQCFRIALSALALGDTPDRIGIDVVRVVNAMCRWTPRRPRPGALPKEIVSARLDAQMARDIRRIPLLRVARAIGAPPRRLAAPRAGAALIRYAALRSRTRGDIGPAPGHRRAFVRLIDPLLRDQVAAVFGAAFPEEPAAAYAGLLERGDALTAWITAPLGGEAGEPDEQAALGSGRPAVEGRRS